ncbi:MAG TPA: hypothetical protein VMI12_04660 [Puia sp.]|nr:hypothetical protein [Puia sp.]
MSTCKEELASGEWDKKYGQYRTQESFTCALRLITATPKSSK